MSTQQTEALRLADWLFDNVEHMNHADAAAELRRLHRQSEVLRAERDHARACYDATVKLLVGIHALLYPAPTTLPDGRVMVFRPKSLDPHDVLQELSDRIRALPDELEKLAAIQQAEAQQPDNAACKSVQKRLEAQQPSSKEHLFELWWEAHMPNATQEQAWTAFTAAVASNGVGIAAQQPATGERHRDAKRLIDTLRTDASGGRAATVRDLDAAADLIEVSLFASPEPVDFPAGAIVNGRTLMERIEAYPFESQGGDLRMCSDWHELRRCFEHLADYASTNPAPSVPDGWKMVPVERSYDQRAKALIAFNRAEKDGKDRDDALQAAWDASLTAAQAQEGGECLPIRGNQVTCSRGTGGCGIQHKGGE